MHTFIINVNDYGFFWLVIEDVMKLAYILIRPVFVQKKKNLYKKIMSTRINRTKVFTTILILVTSYTYIVSDDKLALYHLLIMYRNYITFAIHYYHKYVCNYIQFNFLTRLFLE
jgi:hypothetical protein